MIEESQPLFSEAAVQAEVTYENQLRPKDFTEYIGQIQVMKNIDLMVQSAIKREQAMDHILLSGPPGLGKTSLAVLIAKELETNLHTISGPAVEKKGDLAAILSNLKSGDVLFIDEIHRLQISIEEMLYSAMEDFRLDIVMGQGPTARTMEIGLNQFTLVGATTRSGLLSNPLRDRFVAHLHFDFYKTHELAKILGMNSSKLGLKFEDVALNVVASRSRGTPRIANRILRRIRDYVVVNDLDIVTNEAVNAALNLMEIDERGLDAMDRKILHTINEYYNGGPIGIDALCATLGEERGTIEDVYEPYLLKQGFLIRTARGRMVPEKGKPSENRRDQFSLDI